MYGPKLALIYFGHFRISLELSFMESVLPMLIAFYLEIKTASCFYL
jgi:hypothetical protein